MMNDDVIYVMNVIQDLAEHDCVEGEVQVLHLLLQLQLRHLRRRSRHALLCAPPERVGSGGAALGAGGGSC